MADSDTEDVKPGPSVSPKPSTSGVIPPNRYRTVQLCFKTTYDNTQELHEATGLIKFQKLLDKQGPRYYPGICRWCSALTTTKHNLQRCKNCQLVAYCGSECQRNDWRNHKVLCKEFPAEDGKSILVKAQEKTVGKNNSRAASESELFAHSTYMAKYIERSQRLVGHSTVLMYPRICKICCEARSNKLFDCVCCAVVYCSDDHRKKDTLHLEICEGIFDYMQNRALLTKHDSVVELPCILKEEIKIGSKPVDYKHLDNLRIKLVKQIGSRFPVCPFDYNVYKVYVAELQNIIINRVSFPLTILNILQRLGVGDDRKPLKEVTSLNIHVLSEKPFVDSSIWEYFMHKIPNLKELHITVVSHIFENSDWYMKDIKLKRCKECEEKGRIIKYTIYKNHYHMFSSSEEYTTPDVVAVFGNCVPSKHGLTISDEPNPELTWQNVTKSHKTLLIFTDQSREALLKSVIAVESAVCTSPDDLEKGKAVIYRAKTIDEVFKVGKRLAEEHATLKKLLKIHHNPLINTSFEGSKFLIYSRFICCGQAKSGLSAHSDEFNKINTNLETGNLFMELE